jgi:diaminohydroxyphosphoribosylaminopyrimidine deaminase/5-amino-6-(5-phosphoribosylamino)uracil reductase
MKLALKLAARGAGWVSPNPMVGAVVVKEGQVVGRGYHRRAGEPHAEVVALQEAKDAAPGATLYVTLEPCHHHGRTPPCTQAILQAGVRRVVIATRDPNPQVTGDGAAYLSSQELEVEIGLMEAEASRLNEAWFKWVATGLPWVIAKAACSLDGRIATATGESQWLTGEKARIFGHRLRHRVDAILVGVNTVLADDPQLTTRLPGRGRKVVGGGGKGPQAHLQSSPTPPPPTPYVSGTGFQPVQGEGGPDELTENRKPKTENRAKDPIRIVLDSTLRIPLSARLLHLDSPAPTWVACTEQAPKEKIQALQQQGAGVLVLPPESQESERVCLKALLELLGQRQIQSLLVEGGAETLGAFFEQRLVDKFYFFYAPKFLGGRQAPGVLGGQGIIRLEDALVAKDWSLRRLGPDLLIWGYL